MKEAFINDTALRYRDEQLWEEAKEQQEREQEQLREVSDRWDEVLEALGLEAV